MKLSWGKVPIRHKPCTFFFTMLAWFLIPALLGVYLGFGGFLGVLLHNIRASHTPNALAGGIAFALFVYLPASLGLPFSSPALLLLSWLGSLVVMGAYAFGLHRLPAIVRTPWFGLHYAGIVMGLIVVWGFTNASAAPDLLVGSLAALAGTMAWIRGIETKSEAKNSY